MIATIVSVGLKAVVGLAGLALAWMIATPLRYPPELTSISATASAVDRSGLSVLHRLGIVSCESLPTIAFAAPPNSSHILAATYSYRLMRDFGSSRDYRKDLAAATRPVEVFAGAADELMRPDRYQDAVGERVPVTLINGVNHMGVVSDPAAVSAIADDMVKGGSGS
jgi:pimeloyl-ACP methyl ester carboxylesterase